MNQHHRDNSRMLPSISNLLISSPPPSQQKQKQPEPPKLNLYPASPTIPPTTITSSTDEKALNNEYYLSLENRRYSSCSSSNSSLTSISPVLSPMTSPSTSSTYPSSITMTTTTATTTTAKTTTVNNSLPPLQGDDPPQRLRLPSPLLSPISPKTLFNTTSWNTNNNIYLSSPVSTCSSNTEEEEEEAEAEAEAEEEGPHSCSNHSIGNKNNKLPSFSFSSPSPQQRQLQHQPPQHQLQPSTYRRTASTSSISSSAIPNTQIVFDSTGQPILKRRRGRPPTCLDESGSSFTFLTPTVWDIHVSEEQKQKELRADQKLIAQAEAQAAASAQHIGGEEEHTMLNAFTNSNMDTILQMPKKKRGRKPKTHISGNSCFVWKDLTSTRSPSSSSKQ